MTLQTTDSTFATDVLHSEVPVLVDFWAPWCGPCRMVGPVIDKISEEIDGEAKVYKLNVDENPATASRFGITGIPTVIVFRNGKVETQLMGVQQIQVYKNALGI
ncbi:thioredoxin [Fibrobacterota bacterium]